MHILNVFHIVGKFNFLDFWKYVQFSNKIRFIMGKIANGFETVNIKKIQCDF